MQENLLKKKYTNVLCAYTTRNEKMKDCVGCTFAAYVYFWGYNKRGCAYIDTSSEDILKRISNIILRHEQGGQSYRCICQHQYLVPRHHHQCTSD